MNTETFTPKATVLWSTIRPEFKAGILESVWCSKCRDAVEIVDFMGREKTGYVIVDGKCKVCGCRI